MRNTSYLLVVLICCLAHGSFSQGVKYEVEESIDPGSMPARSMELLNDILKDARKVRFYRETDGDTVSYESKLTWKGDRYSIEFHEDGRLMDIEKLIAFGSIPERSRIKIEQFLRENYNRHKVIRVQQQFSAEDEEEDDREVLEEFMEKDEDDLTIRYEIVADVSSASGVGSYEFLFDQEGDLLQKRENIRRALDNILY